MYKRSEEVRKKIGIATKKAMRNPLIREKIRQSKLGKPSPRKGTKATAETIEKLKKSHLGQTAWNKGLTNLPKQSPEIIENRVKQFRGNLSKLWKGDKVGYGGVHTWIRNHFGKADCCENLNCEQKSKFFEWANISGRYLRKREDFMKLCRSCHRRFDMGMKIIKG